jgi:hypothetical protein
VSNSGWFAGSQPQARRSHPGREDGVVLGGVDRVIVFAVVVLEHSL